MKSQIVAIGEQAFKFHILIAATLLVTACTTAPSPTAPLPTSSSATYAISAPTQSTFPYPLTRGPDRITKKPFGILINPATSPVQPERFSGYHTGIDFETFPDESIAHVPVTAICGGKVRYRNWVSGYGGVAIMDCTLKDQQVTVLYGHLNIDSVELKFGSDVKVGDMIGYLGAGFSKETDGERKHLHLSVHKGTVINLRGYVQTEKELGGWMDPYAS